MRVEISIVYGIIFSNYLIGSLPFGLIFSKTLRGIDPRSGGSGNIGATNVWRVVGKKEGLITVLCDLLKGIPLLGVAQSLGLDDRVLYLVALAAIIGHIFSIFLKFRGGKGVATSLGVLLILSPKLVFVAFIFWAGSVYLSKISSVGAITAFGLLPFLAFLLRPERDFIIFVSTISALVLLRHGGNIQRLIHGNEKGFQTLRK